MTRDEIIATVKDVISREAEAPVESIALGSTLADLGIDSLDVLKLAVAFEKRFRITITTAELVRIKTVNDIVDGLERRVAEAGRSG